MLFRLPSLITRINAFTKQSSNQYINQSLNRVIGLEPLTATPFGWTQVRGFKDKEVLKIRCSNCYFTKVDDRWWVLCSSHPRHKQREKVSNVRQKWIVTHVTRTGRPFRKHFQYPGHDL